MMVGEEEKRKGPYMSAKLTGFTFESEVGFLQ